MKWIDLNLGISTLFSGLYGGIGVFMVTGEIPAITQMSDQSFAEYWQLIDYFMSAIMPAFGALLMLSLVVSAILLYREAASPPAWLMLLALLLTIDDVIFALTIHDSYNSLIDSWNLSELPGDVRLIKDQLVAAFWIRILFMIGVFAVVLLASWLRGQAMRFTHHKS